MALYSLIVLILQCTNCRSKQIHFCNSENATFADRNWLIYAHHNVTKVIEQFFFLFIPLPVSSTYNHHTNFCTRFLCLSHNAGVEVTTWYTVVQRQASAYYGIPRSNFYPGVVTQTKKSGAEVSVMVVSGTVSVFHSLNLEELLEVCCLCMPCSFFFQGCACIDWHFC